MPSSRPAFGRGIRTAVVRTDQRYLADARDRLDILTLHGTFAEALAFVTGYDAARASAYLSGFQRWLATRTDAPPGRSVAELVLAEAGIADAGTPLGEADDARATRLLFDLLDGYLAEKDSPGRF
jgi:hypothetical protein